MRWLRRLSFWLTSRRRDAELAEEMAFHREMNRRAEEARGTPACAAERTARRLMGNPTLAHEDARAVWIWRWVDQVRQDFGYGIRAFVRDPGLAAIAILVVALGVGVNVAVFSVLNALFLKPLPVESPEDLVAIAQVTDREELGVSREAFRYYQSNSTALANLASYFHAYLAASDDARELDGYVVSGNFFRVLGVVPVAGRFFVDSEDSAPGGDPVAVLGFDFWRVRFGADPGVIGQTVGLDGSIYTIIGVSPESIRAPHYGATPADVWIPSAMFGQDRSGANTLTRLIGRLAPGYSTGAATLDLNRLLYQLYPSTNPTESRAIRVSGMRGIPHANTRDRVARLPRILMAGASCLLLIACASLAGLLLARGLNRRQEVAVRLALGAGRPRIIRQFMTESLLIAFIGVVPGVILASALAALLGRCYATEIEGTRPYFKCRSRRHGSRVLARARLPDGAVVWAPSSSSSGPDQLCERTEERRYYQPQVALAAEPPRDAVCVDAHAARCSDRALAEHAKRPESSGFRAATGRFHAHEDQSGGLHRRTIRRVLRTHRRSVEDNVWCPGGRLCQLSAAA